MLNRQKLRCTSIKIVDAKQTKICYAYKNTRLKLLKSKAVLYFNRTAISDIL